MRFERTGRTTDIRDGGLVPALPDAGTSRRRLPMAARVAAVAGAVAAAAIGMFGTVPARSDASSSGRVTLTITARSYSGTYDGREHSASGFMCDAEDGSVTVTVDDRDYVISGISSHAEGRDVSDSCGRIPVTGKAHVTDEDGRDVTGRFDVHVIPGSFEIAPAPLRLRSGDASKPFDGAPLTNGTMGMSESGWQGTDGASYRFTAAQTVPGTAMNAYEIVPNGGTDLADYDIDEQSGRLTVTSLAGTADRIPLAVTATSGKAKRDGLRHEASGYGITAGGGVSRGPGFGLGGVEYAITGIEERTASGVRVGRYPHEVSAGDGFGIYLSSDAEHEHDLSAEFDVSFVPGMLEITPGDILIGAFFRSDEDLTDTIYASIDGRDFKAISTPFRQAKADHSYAPGHYCIGCPSIIWHDGYFWMLSGWNRQDDRIWVTISYSKDLVSWTHPEGDAMMTGTHGIPVDVQPSHDAGHFDMTAPEWFVDDDGSVYIVVSCGHVGLYHGKAGDDHMEVYLSRVTELSADGVPDGHSYPSGLRFRAETARRLSVNDDGADRIDSCLFRDGGTYYLVSKKDGLDNQIWSNRRLAANGWRLVRDMATFGYEGQSLVRFNGTYRMYVDRIRGLTAIGTYCAVADDMSGEWRIEDTRFRSGGDEQVARHGSVLVLDPEKTPDAWAAAARLMRG